MKAKVLFFLFLAAALFIAACGDESSSTASAPKGLSKQNKIIVTNNVERRPYLLPIKQKPLPPANVQTWPMVATGVYKCYDNRREIECPRYGEKYYGQDGQKRIGTRALTSEANDEIVKDSVTSLLWTKKYRVDLNWYEAKLYCDNLRLQNKSWRLPTTAELRTLINYQKVNPAIDDVFYTKSGTNEIDQELLENLSNWFWASKHVGFNSETPDSGENGEQHLSSSWIINFYDGFVEYTSRYNFYNVRCVTSEI